MTPWLGSPTSYASGYIRHHRTSAASQSLTCALSSPPTYCTGFCTRGSNGSSRGKRESMTSRGYGTALAAVAAAVLLAACSPGVAPRRAGPAATTPPATSPAPSPAPTPSASPTPRARTGPARVEATARGDVDGDGRTDFADLLQQARTGDLDTRRFGLRVRLATRRVLTYWYRWGYAGNEGQELAGIADVDGDGRGDVVLSPGASAIARSWVVWRLLGG